MQYYFLNIKNVLDMCTQPKHVLRTNINTYTHNKVIIIVSISFHEPYATSSRISQACTGDEYNYPVYGVSTA